MSAAARSLNDHMIDWLATKGPQEWHGVAVSWNWDNGIEPLAWIVRQPQCDRATAAAIFWGSCPSNLYERAADRASYRGTYPDHYDMNLVILRRWRAKDFGSPRYSFEPGRGGIEHEVERSQKSLDLAIPADMGQPIVGGGEYRGYEEGIPGVVHLAHARAQGEPASPWIVDLIERDRNAPLTSLEIERARARAAHRKHFLDKFEVARETRDLLRRHRWFMPQRLRNLRDFREADERMTLSIVKERFGLEPDPSLLPSWKIRNDAKFEWFQKTYLVEPFIGRD